MCVLGELEDLKAKVKVTSRKELENLVRENRELSKKLESATGTSLSQCASVGGDKGGANRGPAVVEGCTLTVEEAEDGFERVRLISWKRCGKFIPIVDSSLLKCHTQGRTCFISAQTSTLLCI